MATVKRPGVYVEEMPGAARPITAVGTSNTAIFARLQGKGDPVRLTSYPAFERAFGDDLSAEDPDSALLAASVAGFFANGGTQVWIVRLKPDTKSISAEGMALIDDLDAISLVAAPGFTDADSHDAILSHCEYRGDRFAVLDLDDSVSNLVDWVNPHSAGGVRPRASDFGAVYAPWLAVECPLGCGPMAAPPSAYVCGAYSMADGNRGVHKAPANIPLRGVRGLTRRITAPEQELLNPAGVNAIRLLRDGIRIWGARTLSGDGDYRYVSVRRLMIMIEQSIRQGTRWAVFEPNDEMLWKALRRDVGAFLNALWRDGALIGTTPEEAYFVKCDAETTTPADIDQGRVNVLVGVAATKPAEFVILRITQLPGRSDVR